MVEYHLKLNSECAAYTSYAGAIILVSIPDLKCMTSQR